MSDRPIPAPIPGLARLVLPGILLTFCLSMALALPGGPASFAASWTCFVLAGVALLGRRRLPCTVQLPPAAGLAPDGIHIHPDVLRFHCEGRTHLAWRDIEGEDAFRRAAVRLRWGRKLAMAQIPLRKPVISRKLSCATPVSTRENTTSPERPR